MPRHARHVDSIAQAISIRYNNLVYEMRQAGEDVIVLSLGEAFFDIPLFGFDDLPFPALYHYSHSRGLPELRARLARYYGSEYGVPVDPATEMIVTAGSKAALYMAFQAILNPGDEVLVPEPSWVSYVEQIRLCHGVPVSVPYDEPLERLGHYLTDRTRAIVLCSPHNPTGRVFSRAELGALVSLAREHGLFLLADEAYSEFVDGAFVSCGALDPEKRNTIVVNSMSKNYGMSGWRLGYVIANPELTDQILKINQHLITCPATILEHYLERHFDEILQITRPQIRDVLGRRAEIGRLMDELGMAYLPGSATFYFFVSIQGSGLRSEEFCDRLLEEHKVCAVPGIGYGASCDGFIRVSIGAETMERTRHGIEAIHRLIQQGSLEGIRSGPAACSF